MKLEVVNFRPLNPQQINNNNKIQIHSSNKNVVITDDNFNIL